MRALCTIAFILSVGGHAHAQVPDATPSAVEQAGEQVPATETSPEPDIGVASEAAPGDVEQEQTPTIQRVEHPEPIEQGHMEPGHTEQGENVADDDDDRPPLLRHEEPPLASAEPVPRVRPSPWRGYFGASTGLALHLNSRDEFQQGVVAPAYLHLRGGAVLPGRGSLRHGLQLGVATNLSREGAYPGGTLALRQWVVVPSYVLRLGLDSTPLPAWIATARVGVPIVVSPDATVGAELAVGAQYFARAGVAVFAEVIYDVFVGGRVRDGSRSTHHLVTLEVGLQFELEVLP